MNNADILSFSGLRCDGRRDEDIRQISFKLNNIPNCDGSCYFEQGLTKVLAIVHGPMEPTRKNDPSSDDGKITCRYIQAPFSGVTRRRRRMGDRRSLEVEKIIENTFSNIANLELYPNSEILILVHLLESDGSSVCTIINAVSLALMNAGISMKDIVTACSVGMHGGKICQDLSHNEILSGYSYIPVAVSARFEEIIYMQLDSNLTSEKLQSCLQTAIMGCKKIAKLLDQGMKDYLRESYSQET